MPIALLIGNDINNATSSYSWEQLLDDLIAYARIPELPISKNKPFPLLYEEIYLSSAKKFGTKEYRLKRYIASKTRHLKPNEIHQRIMDLGVLNILTTNYDLTFEELVYHTGKMKNAGVIRENRYNIFRHYDVNDHSIWHIHGSLLAPNSITLGYEQYGGYLQMMRNYLSTGTSKTYKAKEFKSLIRRLKDDDVSHESWIDFFFTHDVIIFGLNLDFVEMHLWWLLTYRSRTMVEKKVDINNKIYYFYPSIYESASKDKLELFRINGVETIAVKMTDREKRLLYYSKVLDEIEKLNSLIL